MSRPQFSIQAILLATGMVALALAVLNTPSVWLSGPGLLVLPPGIPAVLVLVLLRSSGYRRAFLIGAIFPACAAHMVMLNEIYGSTSAIDLQLTLASIQRFLDVLVAYDTRFMIGVCWITMPFTGLLCMGAEWALNKGGSRGNPPPASPSSAWPS